MKTLNIAFGQRILLAMVLMVLDGATAGPTDRKSLWMAWKEANDRSYSLEEEDRCFQNWLKNLEYVESFNRQTYNSFKLGLTSLSDMSYDEYLEMLNGVKWDEATLRKAFSIEPNSSANPLLQNSSPLPLAVDWRGALVTPVKNQGLCGSCWAFSATGTLEGQLAKKLGFPLSLSEQELVDCSRAYGNLGCGGGFVSAAFEYALYLKGLCSSYTYKYMAQENSCNVSNCNVRHAAVSRISYIQPGEDFLERAVAMIGPISVAIDACPYSFQLYKSGLYDDPECIYDTNHAVLVVGYGQLDTRRYWIIKNSWGSHWGMGGYMYMAKDESKVCGIGNYGLYAVL